MHYDPIVSIPDTSKLNTADLGDILQYCRDNASRSVRRGRDNSASASVNFVDGNGIAGQEIYSGYHGLTLPFVCESAG